MDEVLKRILDLCYSQKISNKELTERLGVSRNIVTEWKAGRVKSYRKYIYQIADILGVTADFIQNGEKKSPGGEVSAEDKKRVVDLLRSVPVDKREAFIRMLESNAELFGFVKK